MKFKNPRLQFKFRCNCLKGFLVFERAVCYGLVPTGIHSKRWFTSIHYAHPNFINLKIIIILSLNKLHIIINYSEMLK